MASYHSWSIVPDERTPECAGVEGKRQQSHASWSLPPSSMGWIRGAHSQRRPHEQRRPHDMNPLSCLPTQARDQSAGCCVVFRFLFRKSHDQPLAGSISSTFWISTVQPRRRVTHLGNFFSHSEALALLVRGMFPPAQPLPSVG